MSVLWRQTLWYNPNFIASPIITNGPVKALEFAGIPFDTFGTGTLTITATVTMKHTLSQAQKNMSLFLAPPGADITNPAAFAPDPALMVADETGWPFPTSYNTFTFMDGGNSFKNITGPGVPKSLYLWPTLAAGSYQVRRVYVVVQGTYPAPTDSDARTWDVAEAEAARCASLQALMPPTYRLDPGDPIRAVLCVIGTSDNDIGGPATP